ncbi:MAG: NifU family protein [Candidatus Cybelea sp.]
MIDRVAELLAGFDAEQAPRQARGLAEELVRTIASLYGDGLERVLTIMHEELGDRSEAAFARLCEDKLVESLLCLHGLHPIALEDRIQQALESVLPYVNSHKGNMQISRIEGEIVYVTLEGSCDGCPASATTLKLAVERAILQRAPEIREVRAEEIVAEAPMTLRILSPA